MELQVGFLVNRFNQTPHQLGFCEQPDLGLLYRAMEASHIYSVAEKMSDGKASELSIDEGLMVGAIMDMIDHKKRMSKKRLNQAAVFDF